MVKDLKLGFPIVFSFPSFLLYRCLFGDIPKIKNKKRKHFFKLECAGSGKPMGRVDQLDESLFKKYRVFLGHGGKEIENVSQVPTNFKQPLVLWKKQFEGILVKTLEGHRGFVYSLAWHPSQNILASGSDEEIKFWTKEGKLIKTLEGHQDSVYSLAWHPNGQMLASGSEDKTIKFWNLDGTLIKTLEGHRSDVWSLAWHPSGDILASGSSNGKIKLWK